MSKEMRKEIDRLKNFNNFINENKISNIGYLKVEILDDTINNGRNALVKIKGMDGSNREIELIVFNSDLTSDKISNITNKF